MQVRWSEAKAAANLRKHGISFARAAQIFRDPLSHSSQDRHVDGEERWQTIGTVPGIGLILVAHTWEEDDDTEIIRIISARPPTKEERRDYQGR